MAAAQGTLARVLLGRGVACAREEMGAARGANHFLLREGEEKSGGRGENRWVACTWKEVENPEVRQTYQLPFNSRDT